MVGKKNFKIKKSAKTITGFNWRLILGSTTLIFTFNKICLKEVCAQYSAKKLYKENFKPRLPLVLHILFYSNGHDS